MIKCRHNIRANRARAAEPQKGDLSGGKAGFNYNAAYNCADYIAESIKSVQNQSYRNWELIVADDNSTDGTVDAVRSMAADDNRIHLLETDINLGPQRRATGR